MLYSKIANCAKCDKTFRVVYWNIDGYNLLVYTTTPKHVLKMDKEVF